MRQDAQKQSRKFCGSKEGKNSETHPIWAKKGETGCVSGAGGDEHGCGQVQTDGKDRKARRKSWDGLVSAAASVGSRQSATGARSPLGTRFWSGCGRKHQGAGEGRCWTVPAASHKTGGARLVLRGNFPSQNRRKRAGKLAWEFSKMRQNNKEKG